MARLATGKSFLAEYAKLDRDVQSGVEVAIAEHAYPGLYLAKLQHSRDERIRIIRLDSDWGGVVPAPESGDTYCLIAVPPHDKANRHAASHPFSVSQVLGVLEVREEAAIQQLESPPEAVAKSDDKRSSRASSLPTRPDSASPRRSCRWSAC